MAGAPSQPESAEVCAAFETARGEENGHRRTAPLFPKHILSFWFHIGSAVSTAQSAGGVVPASESDAHKASGGNIIKKQNKIKAKICMRTVWTLKSY